MGTRTGNSSTALIIAAMVAVVALVGARLWAHAERNAMPLLWQVSAAADGTVFVLLGTDLHVELPSGDSGGTIDLTRFGVASGIGDFAILADGRIVLPQGRLPAVTFTENLRVMEGRAAESHMPSELLQVCVRESGVCSLLAADTQPYRARRTFRMIPDDDLGRLLIADTTRHEIVMVDMDGRVVDRAGGFSFPNQLQRVGANTVLVADTRNTRFVTLEYGADGFGETVESHRTDCWPGALLRRYPAGVATTGDGAIWATVAMSDMRDAGLYRLPPDAECATQLALPAHADPFFLVATTDSVLVPDSATYRIHRFALDGELMGEFGSPALRASLGRLANERARFDFIFDNSLWALLLIAMPMLLVGNTLRKREQAAAGRDVLVVPDNAPVGAEETVCDRFDVADLARRPHVGHSFRRRFTPLDTDVAFALVVALGIAAYLVVAVEIWAAVTARSAEGIGEFIAGSRGFMVFTVVMGGIVLAYASAFVRERLVIDRVGIRYESYLGGLLRPFRKLAPDWALRWDQVASLALKVAGEGSRARHWLYEIRGNDGTVKVFDALAWRVAGGADGGLRLQDMLTSSSETYVQAIARTRLFRTLAPGRTPAGPASRIPRPAASVPVGPLELVNRPPRFPSAVRRQTVMAYLIIAAILFAIVFIHLEPGYGMPWEWPLVEIVLRIWHEKPLTLLLAGAVMVGALLAFRWSARTIRLDGAGIRLQSTVPDWLKNRFTDWSLPRDSIESVAIKVSYPQNPVGYQIQFRSPSGRRVLPLFGWYRLDQDIETQASPTGYRFTAAQLRESAATASLVVALAEYGYLVKE